MIEWLSGIWEGLVQSAGIEDLRERYLSRILNIILMVLFIWGAIVEGQYRLEGRLFSLRDISILVMLTILGLTYYLNHRGYFLSATILTLGLFISAIFVSAILQYIGGIADLSVLYYMIIAILISELLLSLRGYLITIFIILAGVFGFSLLNPGVEMIFLFLFVFCALITFSSYNRRSIERQQVSLAGKFAREQSLLSLEQRRSAQFGLLEEAGRQIAESLDEREILQSTVEAIVNRFGYAEAAISLLVKENLLEVAAISGTQDYGYRPGYQQELGMGIIGYVGKARKTYIANDVQKDPYYFSNAKHEGSAISVPILDEKELIGVLYIESMQRGSFNAEDAQMVHTLANQVASSIQRARLYAAAQEHLRIMSTVQSISHLISSSLELDEIFQTVVQILKDKLGYTYVSIYLSSDDYLTLGAQSGYPLETVINRIHVNQGVTGRTVMTKETQFVVDVSHDPVFLRASEEIHSEICVPLLKNDVVLGILNVEADSRFILSQKDVELLNMLAGPIALAVDNARLHAQVKEMAMTDAVSGLSNRHAFEETLNAEVSRAQRYGHPLSLIIFDLDSFKDYNDLWGHPAGDVRLKATAELIRANLRKHDIPARYGGDEFAIILPNAESNGAMHFASRILEAARVSTNETPMEGKGVPGYTLSIGVATFPQDGDTTSSLLLAADQAELMAKRLGKNRIFSASDLKNQ
jgi:diguanylate cyclase (GGDEF)-like protein